MYRCQCAALLLFFLAAMTLFAQNQNTPDGDTTFFPTSFRSPRTDGLGGYHAALADDFDTLFINPAGFSTTENQKSVSMLNVTINDFSTIFKLLRSDMLNPGTYDQFLTELKNHFEFGFGIGGPIALGYIGDHFGFGALNHQYMKLWWDRNDPVALHLNVVEEAALYAGHSFPISNFEETVTFTPGFAAKSIFRLVFVPEDLQLVDIRYILLNLQQQPFEMQTGFGFDVGFLLSFYDTLYFAGVCRDIFTPLYVSRYSNFAAFLGGDVPDDILSEWIAPEYDFSVCLRLRNTVVGEFVRDLLFTIDYHGLSNLINGVDRDPLMDFNAGIELRLLTALWLRFGWQRMLPGGGLGIDLGWVKLNAALYGEIFGNQRDDFESMSFSFGLAFRY